VPTCPPTPCGRRRILGAVREDHNPPHGRFGSCSAGGGCGISVGTKWRRGRHRRATRTTKQPASLPGGVRRPGVRRTHRMAVRAGNALLPRSARRFCPDVYHTTSYGAPRCSGPRCGVPGKRVVTIHDMTAENFRSFSPRGRRAARRRSGWRGRGTGWRASRKRRGATWWNCWVFRGIGRSSSTTPTRWTCSRTENGTGGAEVCAVRGNAIGVQESRAAGGGGGARRYLPPGGGKFLDISSPRLFSLYVASTKPSADVLMMNPDAADAARTQLIARSWD
jgi:hypothetical protein